MKKIYVVVSIDDRHKSIVGIFDKETDADNLQMELQNGVESDEAEYVIQEHYLCSDAADYQLALDEQERQRLLSQLTDKQKKLLGIQST